MGFFSEYRVDVNTSVMRVMEDRALADSVKQGTLRALFGNGDIPGHILEGLANGIGLKADRMYAYAARAYPPGLPSGEFTVANAGEDAVAALLSQQEGVPVSLDYCRFTPLNFLHAGWLALITQYQYDALTNSLTIPGLGHSAYLQDMVVVVPASQLTALAPEQLQQWGAPPNAGYTATRPLGSTLGFMGLPIDANVLAGLTRVRVHSPVETDSAAAAPYLRVTYTWQDLGWVNPVTLEPLFQSDSFVLGLPAEDPGGDYFQVKYRAGSQVKYWRYRAGSGTYPALDSVFDAPDQEFGNFYPFAYFRYNHAPTSDGGAGARLLKYLGLDYDQLVAGINANPDIDDVAQAMLVMAVPANSSDPLELRYLYDFFARLYQSSATQGRLPAHNAGWVGLLNADSFIRSATVIQDGRFKMVLSNTGMYKRRLAGVIGAIGTTTGGYTLASLPSTYFDSTTGQPHTVGVPTRAHVYRRQVAAHLYDEVFITELSMKYHIENGYTTIGDETDAILLIPLDRAITREYPLTVRETLYARSLHFVFNSYRYTKLKWYQTGLFEGVLTFVVVLITALSMGSGSGLFAQLGAFVAGAITLQAFTLILLEYLLTSLLYREVFKLFVKLLGDRLAFVIAIIAAVAGVTAETGVGPLAGAPWGQNLLALSSGLTTAVNDSVRRAQVDLLNEAGAFEEEVAQQTKTLETAQELLEPSKLLHPFTLFGETPEDYFQRTIHSGNIGVIGIDAVAAFVDARLTLPNFNDTAGRTLNG